MFVSLQRSTLLGTFVVVVDKSALILCIGDHRNYINFLSMLCWSLPEIRWNIFSLFPLLFSISIRGSPLNDQLKIMCFQLSLFSIEIRKKTDSVMIKHQFVVVIVYFLPINLLLYIPYTFVTYCVIKMMIIRLIARKRTYMHFIYVVFNWALINT